MNRDTLDLLAFAPHPDDAELGCGGTLAKCAHLGHRVGIVDLTRGEMSTQGTVEERSKEATDASAVLKLTWRENLGLPDGNIQDNNQQAEVVVACLRRLKPKLVLVPYWEDRHPDHAATSRLLDRAVFYCGMKNFAPKDDPGYHIPQVLYYQLRCAFKPNFVCDITEFHQLKLQSINCHRSQIQRQAGNANDPQTMISSPAFMRSVEVRDRYYGATIGVEFAEPYISKNTLSIKDPVSFFSSSSMQVAIFP